MIYITKRVSVEQIKPDKYDTTPQKEGERVHSHRMAINKYAKGTKIVVKPQQVLFYISKRLSLI